MQNKPYPIVKDLQGNVIAPYDLPPPDIPRWTANRKATVVRAVRGGLVPLAEVLARYHMTEREFLIWEQGLKESGARSLEVTAYQKRRRTKKE